MAAIGGILAASRLLAVNQSSGGSDLLLLAIAGPVIAGTSLFGGRGSVWSALLGALVIGSISNGMDLLALESSVKFMVTGGVLLVAVIVDALARRSAPGCRQSLSGVRVRRWSATGLAGAVFHAPLIASTDGMEVAAVVTSEPERAAQAARATIPDAEVLAGADALWERRRRARPGGGRRAQPRARAAGRGVAARRAARWWWTSRWRRPPPTPAARRAQPRRPA